MNRFDTSGTLSARAHQGLNASPIGLARVVALAIGISLSIATLECHNEIIYRESRWDHKAIGNLNGTKRVYGLYQMKTESLRVSTPIKQFWMYWHYVGHRYSYTKYDEPNYCKALHHLRTKGWQ